MSGCRSNLAKLQNEIQNLKEQYNNKLTTRCYQLKIHRRTNDDVAEARKHSPDGKIQQPVLERIKLIEDQWRTLDLWGILQSVNPRPILKFDRDELFEQDSTSLENKDDMIFRQAIVLCSMFEDLMRTLGWRARDTLDIEEDLCDVVGQLLMKVEKQDKSTLLDCMQSAIMNIQAEDGKQDGDKLRTLLIKKKKYNGLNLAFILLEQMIIDNKDNNVSWMETLCSHFIDQIAQLIIQTEYRENVLWHFTRFFNAELKWKVFDIYNLMKNGLLTFVGQQNKFHSYLEIIRNFALHPSVNIRPNNGEATVEVKDVIYSQDEHKWARLNMAVCENETEKSLEQVLDEVRCENGKIDKDTIQLIITTSRSILNQINDIDDCPIIIERELDRIRKSEQKYGVDMLSSCLAVTSMALYICKGFWPLNTQFVSYCLLVTQRTDKKGRLLEILTGEGKSCVIAMAAATYALLGRTVDIVTSSPVLSQRDVEEWQEFYSVMKLNTDCNIDDPDGESQCYGCPIVYGTVETFARDILKNEFLLDTYTRYTEK